MKKTGLLLCVLFTLILSSTAYADIFTAGEAAVLTASSTDNTNIAGNTEQYLLTVNKDSGTNSVTIKVGSTTISPVTSGGNTYWISKGDTATISATAKSGYKITSGTGSTGAINAKKTVNITSAVDTYTITWSSALSQQGSYLGTGTYTVGTAYTSKESYKRIIYTNANGQTAYANPYQAGSVKIKAGTNVIFQMVTKNNSMTMSPTLALYGKASAMNPNPVITSAEGNSAKLIQIQYPLSDCFLTKKDESALCWYIEVN